MSWVDLHLHSNCSGDGEFAPEALVQRCAAAGVRVAALADHNTARGVAPAQKAAEGGPVTLIPAIEIDCEQDGTGLHLLGYFINPQDAAFARVEENVLTQEQTAGKERVRLVQKLGIQVDEDALQALMQREGREMITGEMIAEIALADAANAGNALLAPYRAGGPRSDNPNVNFYWDFCAQGKPAYVPVALPTLVQMVRVVQAGGGVPVLAHPGNNVHEDEALLESIVAEGVRGLEVYSSYHSAAQTLFYREWAEKRGLLATVGSDFHGKTKPAIQVGGSECDGCEAALLKALFAAAGRHWEEA